MGQEIQKSVRLHVVEDAVIYFLHLVCGSNDCRILLKNDIASPVLLADRSGICIGCRHIAVLFNDSQK